MTPNDPLYFPRARHAEHLINLLADGIVNTLTLFAPRRMGKTQFLLNDIRPAAEAQHIDVFYFSFMDTNSHPELRFQQSLLEFADNRSASSKLKKWLASIESIDILGTSINRQQATEHISVSEIISVLAQGKQPVLLLLDEIQELARIDGTAPLIRSLRTGLDMNKTRVKTIFTGSSTNGLRQMFNDNKAPFFQFSHPIDFPKMGQEFTDFLADIYRDRTGQDIDKPAFYRWFERLEYIPMHARTIVQDMIINPALSLEDAAALRLAHLYDDTDYSDTWRELKALDRQILKHLAHGEFSPYKQETREQLAREMGIDALSTSQMQAAMRRLERADLITRDAASQWAFNHPDLKGWIKETL